MDLDTIRADVEAAFAQTGAALPGWPGPHPDRQPEQEEYSRCLDPGKYKIATVRAEAWVRVLTRLELAIVEPVEPSGDTWAAWRDGPPSGIAPVRAVRLRPHQRGAAPLLLSFRGFDGVEENLVTVSFGEPAVPLGTMPFCGCDACDDGSEVLLDELDTWMSDVITGEVVHVTTADGTVTGYPRGWESANVEDVDRVLADARAGRSPHQVVQGTRWW